MLLRTLSEQTAEGNGIAKFLSQYGFLIILAIMVLVFWFFVMRPQRKQEKEVADMRNNLKINDEIVTVGGIVGIITNVSGKDTITIVTSRDKTRIQILRTAVSRVQVPADDGSGEESGKQN